MRLGGIVATVVVGALVVGGAVVADGVLRSRTEADLAADLQVELGGLDTPPEVTIDGFPFLTQVLDGRLSEVHVTAAEAVVEDLALRDVDVRLEGVSTDEPTTVEEVRLEAFLPLAEVEDLVPVDAGLTVEGETLVGSGSIFGLPVELVLVPSAAGREIEIAVEALRIGGATVSVEDLPDLVGEQLQGLAVPLEQLPEGLRLTDLVLEQDGVRLTAEGSDVTIERGESS